MIKIKTWHVELAVVVLLLVSVALLTGGQLVEWIGVGAVSLSFCHIQVADRLAEQDAVREKPSVECYRRANYYLVSKETLWLVYFVLHSSWSALVGVGLFLLYPFWRKYWRKHHAIQTTS